MCRLIYAHAMIVITLCASPVFANYSPFPDAKSMSALPSILLLDYASDLFFIMLSLFIMEQAGKIKLNTILKVSFLALVAGFAADEIGIRVTSGLFSTHHVSIAQIITGAIVSILLIAYANFVLARHYFKLDHSQSLTLGLIVGICTMPGGILLVENLMYSGFQRVIINQYFDKLTGLGGHANIQTYVIVGSIFATADIILLFLLRPVTSLNRAGIGVFVLLITTGVSLYTYIPYTEQIKIEREIMICSGKMRNFASTIIEYEKKHGDYPSNELLKDLMHKYDCMYCDFDMERSGITSYEYRKPPDDFKFNDQYWMLKCTHHQKYDLYTSASGSPMRALPKGESYK